jgi:hypothetical protein
MTDKEAMKLALFALDIVKIHYTQSRHVNEAITALKERLAQPEQEPVAWQFMNGSSFRKRRPDDFSDLASDGLPYWKPLYTTPPQRTEPVIDKSAAIRIATALGWTPPRTWVGLTDEEQRNIAYSDINCWDWGELMDAVEAKLKQKNGYTEEKNT